MPIRRLVALMLVLVVAVTAGCGSTAAPSTSPQPSKSSAVSPSASTAPSSSAPAKPSNPEVILSTTTSTQDSGLLDVLIPMFEKQTGYKVKPIAVGSGQAMTMGERGEADVLLVHAPDSEKKFMENGHGIERKLVMHNDFVVVGPSQDPAKIKGEKSALEALKKIMAAQALFTSRGDNSGTHQLELKLWKLASVDPKGQSWYQETGQGMGATLNVAAEKSGYTITDRATYLANQKSLKLEILVEGDSNLLNVYHAITIDPKKSDKINAQGGKAFADFMVSKETQAVIEKFGVDKYGQPLFFPDADKTDADLGLQ